MGESIKTVKGYTNIIHNLTNLNRINNGDLISN